MFASHDGRRRYMCDSDDGAVVLRMHIASHLPPASLPLYLLASRSPSGGANRPPTGQMRRWRPAAPVSALPAPAVVLPSRMPHFASHCSSAHCCCLAQSRALSLALFSRRGRQRLCDCHDVARGNAASAHPNNSQRAYVRARREGAALHARRCVTTVPALTVASLP